MDSCKHCQSTLTGKFCANCGSPAQIKRIDAHYIVHEIEHVLHFEKGILYTVRELLLRPGHSLRTFLSEDRGRLVKPIIFIIITSLLYSIANHYTHVEDGYISVKGGNSAVMAIFGWVQSHYGYANIIMGVFIAFWTRLFFRKYGLNFFEIVILLCYVIGVGMLILTVASLLEAASHLSLMSWASGLSMVYASWAIGQCFEKKLTSYLKAFAAYILGFFSFSVVMILLGVAVDKILH